MGSDRHPRPEVEGALLAARHYGVRVLLVGPEDRLRQELSGHPSAHNLPMFALMGAMYYRAIFKNAKPTVGILSIGEEEGKGNELTRKAHSLIKDLPLNFVGNVEGRDLYNGKVDVIVCDGFVGNVALKTSEGVANLVRATLKESLKATITRQVGFLLSRSAYADFKKRLDHTEYG